MSGFLGHLALQQRVLPTYRVPFIKMLARACNGGLSVYAGMPCQVEGISAVDQLEDAQFILGRNLHFKDPSSRYYLCWQRGLVGWLVECDPDALIVEANPRYLSTRIAVRWMQNHGRPVLGWGLGVPHGGNPLELILRRSFLISLDGIIAYSNRGAAEYRSLGIGNVSVVYNAVAKRPVRKIPNRPAVKDGKSVVLFVGRLQVRKRLDILFEACRDLPADLQPELIIVGEGPARSNFEDIAKQVYPGTVFTGAVHGKDLDPFFEKADLFVLPGTGGLAIQQAMTFGLPVIVAQGDGTQEDLVRPENGWQVPPGDQESFTTVLCEALSDIPRLQQMGVESYRIVSEEINLEMMVMRFVEALNNVQKTY